MKRILSTVLAVIPAIALGFLSFRLYTERPRPVLMARADIPAEDTAPATIPPAATTDDVFEAEAAPGTPTTASDPATPTSDAVRFEEERLANLRESLAELNEEGLESAAGASDAEDGDVAEARSDGGEGESGMVNARVEMLEAAIKRLSSTRAEIDVQLQRLDTQILETQTRLNTLKPAKPTGSADPQVATLQAELSALQSTREQLDEQRAVAPETNFVAEAEAASGVLGERLMDLRGELEYWRARQTEGNTPELRVRREEQLKKLISSQEDRLRVLGRTAVPPRKSGAPESITQ